MRLAAETHGADTAAPPLLIAHGLLGSARNWSSLGKRLARARKVVAVDMRNHGDSPRDPDTSYAAMADDLAQAVAQHAGGKADVLGHSMGGKAAMALALSQPELVRRLVVADIAPVAYDHSHADILAAMAALDLPRVTRRVEADRALAAAIPDAAMRAFVVQNLVIEDGRARWRPDIESLSAGMAGLVGFPDRFPHPRFDGPALFLRGGASDYAAPSTYAAILARFPLARIETLADAGHWLHAEKPEAFLAAVEAFLAD